jgi:cysteinyl-tRNA synthetase
VAAAPLVGPFDGTAARLRATEPGRLAVDVVGRPDAGAGWVEPAGVAGDSALVRISTAGIRSDPAVAEAARSVLDQVRAAGVTRVVLDADDADRERVLGGAAARADALDVVLVPPMQVTNSLGRRLERIVTGQPGSVGMYSCGPTVYSYQHLGNMRTYVFSDTLKRALLWRGYAVRHVINITDVGHLLADADQGEDKVEEASRREGRSVEEITGHYTAVYLDDLRSLNVLFPDVWPKASEHVPQMIDFAKVLEDRGYAYVVPEGLYFETARSQRYGELAGIDFAGQRATGRVETVEGKRAASDFALWRTFTDGRQRLMQWDSPWGIGAPGWHLECSVMSMADLGDHFDIHTGGIDHRELHHVNEIAQSEAYLADGRPWVRYWVHGEFLKLEDRKISKSAGDTVRVADLVAVGIHPLGFRYLLLGSHYGSQVVFTERLAREKHVGLRRLALAAQVALADRAGDGRLGEPTTLLASVDAAGGALVRDRLLELDAEIASDLQTPKVLALVTTWLREPQAMSADDWLVLLRAVNTVTGLSLGLLGAADFVPPVPDDLDLAWVEDRVAERDAARAAKDWAMADRMRDELGGRGVRVEDTPEGSHWYYAPPS